MGEDAELAEQLPRGKTSWLLLEREMLRGALSGGDSPMLMMDEDADGHW